MKRFRFRLDPALRVRRFERDRAARELASRRRDAERLASAVDSVHAELEAIHGRVASGARDGVDAWRWRAAQAAVDAKAFAAARAHAALQDAEGAADAARDAWLAARRKVRSLEALRERALTRHRQDALREEQSVLDEIATTRSIRRRRC